jgi:diacylglycerol O-acyltransferase / wax synthase
LLTLGAVVDLLRTPTEQLRAARALLRTPRNALSALRDVANGVVAFGRELRPATNLSIEGAIGPHRRWAFARTSLDELKGIRRVLGGTINDLILSVITSAFRDLLIAGGDPVNDVVVRSPCQSRCGRLATQRRTIRWGR